MLPRYLGFCYQFHLYRFNHVGPNNSCYRTYQSLADNLSARVPGEASKGFIGTSGTDDAARRHQRVVFAEQPYVTECIYLLVSEGHFLQKIVDISITISNQNTELMISWGGWHSKTNFYCTSSNTITAPYTGVA